jgi:hypothetical protein
VQIVSHCLRCCRAARFESGAAPSEVVCPKCGERRDVHLSASILEKNVVDRCALCGCGHLYLEKDFNGTVGFGLIVLAVAGSAVAWGFREVALALGILAGAALVDLAFWIGCRDRAVCYKCAASYRGAAPNPAHGRYDLGTAGRFADDFDAQRELHQK